MSESGHAAGTVQTHNSYLLVLIVLPAAIMTTFAAALFAGFVGDQASEIAKLIYEIEISCRATGIGAAMAPLDAQNTNANVRMCHAYFTKVVGFYGLIAAWCVCSFYATASLGRGLKSQRLRYWLSALVAVSLPAIILAKYWVAGQYQAYFVIDLQTLSYEYYGFPLFSVALIALLVVLLALLAWQFSAGGVQAYNGVVKTMFWLSIVVFVATSVLFTYLPGNPYELVGSINIIVLFVLLAYLFMSGLFLYSQQTGWPVAGMFLLYFVAVNVLGSTENRIQVQNKRDQPPFSREASVMGWLKARKDLEAFPGGDKKYPIYIIASSGGGMYAAMRTAYYLETLQKSCPRFLHHTFAISSVSGGAIGALAFAADQQASPLKINAPCNFESAMTSDVNISDINERDDQRTTIDKFFESDVVSSIVGGGLFPGLLRRLSPLPLPQSFDRANAFRLVLSNAWRQAVPKNLHSSKAGGTGCTIISYFADCTLDEYWRPDGDFPVMIFNATWVELGMPTVLSNLPSQYFTGAGALTNMISAFDVISGVKLVDGASISSRFPIALPAGVLTNAGLLDKIELVDGGYFDNSGLMAARAVAQQVEAVLKSNGLQDRAQVQLIYLGEDYSVDAMELYTKYGNQQVTETDTFKPAPKKSWQERVLDLNRWFSAGSDLGAHGKTLLNARDQRSLESVRLLRESADRSAASGTGNLTKLMNFEWVLSRHEEVEPCRRIPLAWYLAPCSRNRLKTQLGDSLFSKEQQLRTLQEQLSP